ncbi:response regulator [Arthrobacter sp.]|uniref:response regulator n=1 Tax=Arthrobacter sp. TaxID=1667 RepID=UPI00339B65C0
MAEPVTQFSFSAPGHGVFLLDDYELVLLGLRHLLAAADIPVLGESASARQAIRRIPALRPQLAVLDANLPDGTGTAVCRAIRATDPTIHCLILADTTDETTLIAAVLSEAWGCLSKQDDNVEQLRLIRRALAGGTAFSSRFQHLLQPSGISPQDPHREGRRPLSRQETNAAIGLGQGKSNRQIAQDLDISEKSVKNLVASVLHKLGMATRTQAAVFIATSTNLPPGPDSAAGQAYIRSPKQTTRITAALLNCIKEGPAPLDDTARAQAASALAAALAGTKANQQALPSDRQHAKKSK